MINIVRTKDFKSYLYNTEGWIIIDTEEDKLFTEVLFKSELSAQSYLNSVYDLAKASE